MSVETDLIDSEVNELREKVEELEQKLEEIETILTIRINSTNLSGVYIWLIFLTGFLIHKFW